MPPTRRSLKVPVSPVPSQQILDRFHHAVARVDALIERDNTPHGKTPAEIRQRAAMRLDRMRRFLASLGDPHLRFPVIHVTGTSGKGSTSTAIARILEAAGLRVGLHTSPYLQTPTEKLQLDGRLIAPGAFADLVDRTLASHDRWVASGNDVLTYGEIWVAMVCLAFADLPVDVAVIEVGAGGRFDLTNVVQPVVSVITSVGIDHVLTLGHTIAEIAWHKAGIIKPGAAAVTGVTDPVALLAITEEATAADVPLVRVIEGETYRRSGHDAEATRWLDLTPGGIAGELPAAPGGYQAGNAAIAVAAVRAFAERRRISVAPESIIAGLAATRIPGRYERIRTPGDPVVILDGAHNPQKVAALMADLGPSSRAAGERMIVVLGSLEAKQIDEMAGLIAPWADTVVLTSPQVLAKIGAETAALGAAMERAGFDRRVISSAEPSRAIDEAIRIAHNRPGAFVLVTGSLYLIGNVRGRWYADDAITLGQSPWPAGTI